MAHALKVLAAIAWLGSAGPVGAAQISLFEAGINRDGDQPTPDGVAYDLDASGLGAIRVLVTGAGEHFVIGYLDFDIGDVADDEFGGTVGAPGAGQSWEIDGPGFGFGDLYDNFQNGALDNSNAVPPDSPADVALGLGWNFILPSGAVEVVFHTSLERPDAPFYLWQSEQASDQTVYLWSTISAVAVPEPGALALFGIGLGLLRPGRRRRPQ